MLRTIFHTPWHLMRWVRLLASAFALVSFTQKLSSGNLQKVDYLILAAGFYFLYKALFNSGCEVMPQQEDHHEAKNSVDYEEIK